MRSYSGWPLRPGGGGVLTKMFRQMRTYLLMTSAIHTSTLSVVAAMATAAQLRAMHSHRFAGQYATMPFSAFRAWGRAA